MKDTNEYVLDNSRAPSVFCFRKASLRRDDDDEIQENFLAKCGRKGRALQQWNRVCKGPGVEERGGFWEEQKTSQCSCRLQQSVCSGMDQVRWETQAGTDDRGSCFSQ